MATYNIPRNVKGEGRILYIFSTKALIYTFIGAIIGGIIYFIFDAIGMGTIGLLFIVGLGAIGFSIATFKIPKIRALNDISGENIDEVIKRYIKFKSKKNKIYSIYTKEKEEK